MKNHDFKDVRTIFDFKDISAIFRKRDESEITKCSACSEFLGFLRRHQIQDLMFRNDELTFIKGTEFTTTICVSWYDYSFLKIFLAKYLTLLKSLKESESEIINSATVMLVTLCFRIFVTFSLKKNGHQHLKFVTHIPFMLAVALLIHLLSIRTLLTNKIF